MGWLAIGFSVASLVVVGIAAVEIYAERHLPVDFPD